MARPIRALIDCAALRHNLALLQACAPRTRMFAVVKANAYGHGLLRVASALAHAGGFAVLELDGAISLREAGFRQPILLLEGFFSTRELALIGRSRLSCVVHGFAQVRMLESARLSVPLEVFIKINSGMNRLGFQPHAWREAWQRLRDSGNVAGITLMTHFACADDARGIDQQLICFEQATAGVDRPVSLANSAAILRYPQTCRDWARPGIALFGASPFADRPAQSLGLKPVMSLCSELIAVRELASGESLGYGASFIADRALRIGIVACGYADGYPRKAPTGTPILVADQRTRTLGRVSMDMLCVDLSDMPRAAEGTQVVLWGEGLPVEEVAAAADTISYELLCALAPRVPVSEK